MKQEVVGPLGRVFGSQGIEWVGTDLDDTVTKTSPVFDEAIYDAGWILTVGPEWEAARRSVNGNQTLVEQVEINRGRIVDVLGGLRSQYGVRPQVLELAVMIAGRWSGLAETDKRIELAGERMRRIYGINMPGLLEGGEEMVEVVNAASTNGLWLISHSDQGWMDDKVRMTGLTGRFARRYAFGTDRPKAEQYGKFFIDNNIDPKRFLMFGDNLEADILPILDLGGMAVWVRNDYIKSSRAIRREIPVMPSLPRGRFVIAETTAMAIERLIAENS